MNKSHLAGFGQAMARGDIHAAFEHLSDEVALYSPIFDAPFVGKAAVGRVMGAVKTVVTKSERIGMAEGEDSIVNLTALAIGDVTGNGIEAIHLDQDGRIDRITVFWRPLQLALAGHERLAPLLDRDSVL